MTLHSQTARPIARRSHMYRRRRRRGRFNPRLILVVMLGVAAILVWKYWPRGVDEATERDRMLAGSVTVDPDALGRETETYGTSRDTDRTASPVRPPSWTEPIRSEPTPAETKPNTPEASRPDTLDRETRPPDRKPERTTPRPPTSSAATQRAKLRFDEGLDLIAANNPVEARRRLSTILQVPGVDPALAADARRELARLSERLVFSPEIVEDDQFSLNYTIESGDLLSRISLRHGLQVEWQFLKRVNFIPDERRIRAGQRIKLVTGPFHAIVDKTDFRMDVYLGDGDDRVYVTSFSVGLGEFNGTPTGLFRIRSRSKLIDPQWRNPRTNEFFESDDPANPIGEFWLGLEGIDEGTRLLSGYGIHGTVEPESIGREASMGCIRMMADDVEVIWEILKEEVSTVLIQD